MAAWAAPVLLWIVGCTRRCRVGVEWWCPRYGSLPFLHHSNALGCATQFPFPVAQNQGQRQTTAGQHPGLILGSHLAHKQSVNTFLRCSFLFIPCPLPPSTNPFLPFATLWPLFRGFRAGKTPVAVADATPGCKFPLNVNFCTSFWIKLFSPWP